MRDSAADLYYSLALVGKSERCKSWSWDTWGRIVPVLDPLVSVFGKTVAVRSTQTPGKDYRQDVRFGRMGWDDKSHQKWAHGSPLNHEASRAWRFYMTEIWAPSWTACERKSMSPHLVIRIENPFFVGQARPGQFNQLFLMALHEQVYHAKQDAVRRAIEHIAVLIESVLIAHRVSPWNLRGDCVDESLNNHLMYLGIEKDVVPDLSKMSGQWLAFDPGTALPR